MTNITKYDNLPYHKRSCDMEGNYLNIVDWTKRKDRQINVGDIYIYKSNNYEKIIKLTKKSSEYNSWYYDEYNVDEEKWITPIYHWSTGSEYIPTIGEDSIKDYYGLLLEPIEELIKKSKLIFSGQLSIDDIIPQVNEELSSSTEITKKSFSKDELYSLADNAAIMKNKVSEYNAVMKFIIENNKRNLEKLREKMTSQLSLFQHQLTEIMKVIQAIELYSGINEEVFQICSGEPANENIPISIRQMILYMDEEVSISDIYGHVEEGFDYTNINDFYKWLMNSANRDRIIPEEKGIVVLKPRRKNKYYCNDNRYNDIINRWNKESYIIIRNGENLYSIYTQNIVIYDRVFPKKSDLQEIMKNITERCGFEKEVAEEKFKSLETRSRFFAMLVQGLIDRSDVFSPINPNVSIFKGIGIEFIYDEENILTDGRKSYKDWKSEINSTIARGSRIGLITPMTCGYNKKRGDYRDRYYQYYVDEYSMPDLPDIGVYTVESKKRNGYKEENTLCIRYFAGGEYYKFGEGYVRRKLKTAFEIYPHDFFIINYDRLSLEDIDYYINNRVDREYYYEFMPLFKSIRKLLIKEMKMEKEFIKMLKSEYSHYQISDKILEEKIQKSIEWWKYKVIWKRPITKDDAKAYRMIIQYMKNTYGLTKKN